MKPKRKARRVWVWCEGPKPHLWNEKWCSVAEAQFRKPAADSMYPMGKENCGFKLFIEVLKPAKKARKR